MVNASSAFVVNTRDHVENVADADVHAQKSNPLDVLASYSPDMPSEEELSPPSEVTSDGVNKPRRKSPRLGRLQETTAIGLALCGLLIGYVAWRLSDGPLSIGLAKPLVEDALEDLVGGQAKIGTLRLAWDKEADNFVVTATQVRATTDARTSPLTLGEVNLTLDAAALLTGKAQIERASITGLQAVLIVDKEGRTAFGFGTPAEVLALPRQIASTKGLRPVLESMRLALLRNNKNGRVDAINLNNARLIIIDPDTNGQITLNNARASITTNAQDIVTLQASGFAQEMGGTANVAVSSGPDKNQPLAFAARFENARLSQLPASLRVGPLASVAEDTVPLTGYVNGRVGDGPADLDVRARLNLGAGRLQGVDLTRASGDLVWNGAQQRFTFTDLSASGPKAQIEGANGRLETLDDGQRTLVFDARRFDLSDVRFGNVRGRDLRGTGRASADNQPVSGNLSGGSLSIERQAQVNITAQGFDLTLANLTGTRAIQANLTAQSLTGTVQGKAISARGLRADLSANRTDLRIVPTQLAATAQNFQYAVPFGATSQAFDASGLVLNTRDFSANGVPNNVRFSANQMNLPASQNAVLGGSARDVSFEGSGLLSGAARIKGNAAQISSPLGQGNGVIFDFAQTGPRAGRATGSVAQFSSAQGDGRGLIFDVSKTGQTEGRARGSLAQFSSQVAQGRGITFDVAQTGARSGRIQSFEADNFSVAARGGSVAAAGLVATGSFTERGLVNSDINAKTVEVVHSEQLVRPFWADNLRMTGDFTTRSAALNAFSFRHRGVSIVGSGQIALAPRGSPSVQLDADVTGAFSVQTLIEAWPQRFLRDTREAIRKLVPSGTAEVQRLRLAVPAGMMPKQILPENGMDLAFTMRDVTVQYLPGMAPITDVHGSAVLTGTSMVMTLPEGRIGDVKVTDAKVEIPQFMPTGAHAFIDADITGDVSTMSQELDRPALAVFSKAGFNPARLSGAGTAHLNLDLPLIKNLVPDDIGITARGTFQQAGLLNAFAGLDASNATVTLGVANRKIDVAGQAWLAGNLFNFEWANDPSAPVGSQIRLAARGDVTVQSLRSVGLELGEYANGPFAVDIATNMEGSQFGEARIKADFRNTNIRLPGNAWSKTEGVEGVASAQLYPREGGGWNVQDVRFDSDGAMLRGALDLTDNAQLVDARFSRVVIANTSDLSVDVTPHANALTVTMRGAYLNLAPYLGGKDVSEKAVDLLDRPLTLSADIGRVATGPGRELTDVHADIVRDQEGWRTLDAAGSSTAGRSQISLNVQRDGRRTVSGILSDAGFFAQLLYPGAPVFGGTGTIEGELPVVGANSSGILAFTGKDIRIERDGTTPIVFDNVQLPMSVQGGIVTLRDGQADGDAYTVKASGFVDVGAGRLDFRGVATPGGLNRVLSDIPLFGAILGGGQDEGLLGLTFTAKGPMTAPRIRTNPISALAPGFLRKIFESEAPLSPTPRLVASPFLGQALVEKWPYGPTEDMSERPSDRGPAIGPAQ